MNFEDDIELNILCCLICNPKLMEKIRIEDKHFRRHKRMWAFMKAFYNKFHTFDTHLMVSVASDKRQVVEYTSLVLYADPIPSHFDLYQDRLIEIYEENEKDKWIIKKVYDLANDLLVRHITVQDFKEGFDKICSDAGKIFKEVKKDDNRN